jgi:hypothetical protein
MAPKYSKNQNHASMWQRLLTALSGWGRDDNPRCAVEAGFDDPFVKPIEIDALERLLAL